MVETITINKLYNELKELKENVVFIKKHMFDPDTILTTEEERRFEQSLEEIKTGKTKPLADLKKELGL
ncbi:hypothetical protein COV18_00345 [Candidatus Woesearchaeota archaeon CG10_big_fil_rev_8_21_14_0_10_37_12]|nr:MAG: hypothetical protein COV18_00345 [Candidatus Woesearchaeota archaeon CG10_big_fil_rev_8_21_14_0_10_37_12]